MFELASLRGLKPNKQQLARLLYPEQGDESRCVSMSRLLNGKTRMLSAEKIATICNYLQCTADELIGRTDDDSASMQWKYYNLHLNN